MKSAQGQGTIEKIPSGKWRFRIWLPGGKRKWSPACNSYEDALALRTASLKILAENQKKLRCPTLQEWGEMWLSRRNNGNIVTERYTWKNHIETALFFDKPLNQITRTDLKYWLFELQKKPALVSGPGGISIPADRGISGSTQSNTLNLLRKCLRDAWDEGLIQQNPAEKLKVECDASPEEEWTYLNTQEIHALLTCEQIAFEKRLIYQFAIYTGLRQGEIWGLRWRDIHIEEEHAYLIVKKSYDGKTKNKRSRKVPLFAKALSALLAWRERNPHSQDVVFCKPDGSMYAAGHDNGWADRKEENGRTRIGHKTKAGILREVKFHDLRHSCASHLVMGTWGEPWSIYEVRDLLGHRDITTTQRYAHLSPEHLQYKAQRTASGATVSGPRKDHEEKPPRGIEPLAYGLRKRSQAINNKGLQDDSSGHGVHDFVHDPKKLAQEILNLQQLQEPIPTELITQLAQFILEQNPETILSVYLAHPAGRAQA